MASVRVQSFKDLVVWQQGMILAERCYRITQNFPKEETYGMVSQIRRAATSIPANIAEGYGRHHRKEYVHFLYVAQGSLKELETHLILCERVALLSPEALKPVMNQIESVSKLLRALINALQHPQKNNSRIS